MNVSKLAVCQACLLLGLWASAVAAAREWVDSTGKNKTEATFLEIVDDTVRLKKPDGKLATIRLAKLSRADQAFALEESMRRQDEIPMLSREAQAATRELLAAVREAAKKHDGAMDVDYDEIEEAMQAADAIVKEKLEAISSKEGSQRALVPAVIEMLQDKNVVVRITGLATITQLGSSITAAGPTVGTLLADPSPTVRHFAVDALRRMSAHTDTPVVGLAEVVAGDDEEAAEIALETISEFSIGPRANATLPKLAAMLKEPGRAQDSRRRVAQALSRLAGGTEHEAERLSRSRFDRLLENGDVDATAAGMMRARSLEERSKARQQVCQDIAPLLADKDVAVQQAVALILAVHEPEQIAKLPADAIVGMLTAELGEEDDYSNQQMLRHALTEMIEAEKLELKLTPAQLMRLIPHGDAEIHPLVRQQLDQMGSAVKGLLPELAKLAEDPKGEVRLAALAVLTSEYFVSADDLSALPTVSIVIGAGPKGELGTIACDGKPVAGLTKLPEAIASFTPVALAKGEVTVEEILKKALRDESGEVSHVALGTLGRMRTPAALAILRDTARNALDRDLRERAKRQLDDEDEFGRPRRGDDDDDDEDSDDGPFVEAPAESSQPRALVAQVTLAPTLSAEHLVPILNATIEAKTMGVRLRFSGEGAPPELHLQSARAMQGRFDRTFITFTLARKGDAPLDLRAEFINGHQARRAPNLEAAQFLVDFLISLHFPGERGYYDHEYLRLGSRALSAAGTINYDGSVRGADVAQALAAMGSTKEQGVTRDMVQWIRLIPKDSGASYWFLKVADSPAVEKQP